MRILLIHPGFGKGLGFQRTALVEPLGLELVASSLLACGHEVRILDLRMDKNLQGSIRDFDPHLCGISCSFTTDVYRTLRIAEAVKKFKRNAFVVVGGHHASLSPADLCHPSVDAVALGEGEETACDLAGALESGKDIQYVPGLVVNQGGGQRETPPRETLKELDSLPFPARQLTQKYRGRYFLGFQRPLALMETARGCVYRCEFCSVWKFHREKCRTRTPERVFEEIASIGAEYLLFTDDNFFFSAVLARRIAELLIDRGVRKRITFQVRSDAVVAHPEVISLWKKVGLWKVFIGFEKIEDGELSVLGKRNTVKNNEEALRILRSQQIEVCASFIVDPQFERRDFEKLRHYIRQWKLYFPSFTILTPLPGTELYRRLRERLTTENLELFDCVHAVLPTRLSLPDFYHEFCDLYRTGYPHMRLGWDGLAAWVRRLDLFPHFFMVMRSAGAMGNEDFFLSGHQG
jgi:radical SAM superfamily enzyme YgiQ (UPF0313 family)